MSENKQTTTAAREDQMLTSEQWKALGQVADLVVIANRALEGPLGNVLTEYALQASSLAMDGWFDALHNSVKLLVELDKTGILDFLQMGLGLVSSAATQETLARLIEGFVEVTSQVSLAELLRDAFEEASKETTQDPAKLGGIGGLLKVMTDRNVQAGLRLVGGVAGKLYPLLHDHLGQSQKISVH
ncbi:MAG: DUF1641 domain-containing protein [Firmicutes bacterium]|nr:DUF1641 domain-containing protein [Bacillota bacterium]